MVHEIGAVKKTVRIACHAHAVVPLHVLSHLQGDMKILPQENSDKLAELIRTQGFSAPFNVWRDPHGGKYWVLDGHQRLKTLRRMENDGYYIPPLPINLVDAADIQEAKEKLLAMASQFGSFTKGGTEDFLKSIDTEPQAASQRFSIPRLTVSKEQTEPPEVLHPELETSHYVLIPCKDAAEQFKIYSRLTAGGYVCSMQVR